MRAYAIHVIMEGATMETRDRTIYLDECGYTGEELFDLEQPVFVVATHDYSPEECEHFKSTFFSSTNAKELKHNILQRRPSGRAAVLSFLRTVLATPNRVMVSAAHKRYALTGKMVDIVVEPAMHRDGLNIYAHGGSVAFTNMVWAVLQSAGSTTLKELLRRFQRMVRTRSEVARVEFERFLSQPALVDVIDETLDYFRLSVFRTKGVDLASLPRGVLDVSAPLALSCVYGWKMAGAPPQQVIHDESNNMARQKLIWDAILSPSAPAALVGNGSQVIEFPIGVESTTFVSSKHSLGLQIADVVAGAVSAWLGWLASDERVSGYGADLNAILGPDPSIIHHMIWPSPSVEPEPDREGATDSLEYLTHLIAKAQDTSGF